MATLHLGWLVSIACWATATAWPWDPKITIPGLGSVEGHTSDGVKVFNHIPFAQPPVGDLRFRAPQPAHPWGDTIDGKKSSPICPQIKVGVDMFHLGQEDCLYLDVYVPEKGKENGPMPVLFWIFGGGYSLGDGYEFGWYDGRALAAATGAVVVTANYRVGPFGFLSHPALQREDPDGSTGNMGVRDQQMALHWVHDHISAFNGDPSRVTIFGESAGGFSVCWHLASPLSKGLFAAAITESGSCDTAEFFMPVADQSAFGSLYASKVIGCNDTALATDAAWLECVRNAETGAVMNDVLTWLDPDWPGAGKKLLETFTDPLGMIKMPAEAAVAALGNIVPFLAPIMPWGPVVDGTKQGTMRMPLETLRMGEGNYVPTIWGSNKDEGSMFVPAAGIIVKDAVWPIGSDDDLRRTLVHFYPNKTVEEVMVLYPLADFAHSQEKRCEAILRDCFFSCAMRRGARAMDAHHAPSWLYHFEYPMHWIESGILGNYHTSELYFVWGNKFPPIPLVHDFNSKDHTMASTFQRYWGNLARHLDPNGASSADREGVVYWPQHNKTTDMNLVLDLPPAEQTGLYAAKCDYWDNHMTTVGGQVAQNRRSEMLERLRSA